MSGNSRAWTRYNQTNMRLLYLSCHAILEYDELKLFGDLGIDYFALGSYVNPRQPVDPIRPALDKDPDPELYHMAPPREDMPQEFLEKFDVIMVMDGHPVPTWIGNNWEKMKDKRVIWRTIGQSTSQREAQMKPFRDQGMQVVRYSPREENIPGNIGCDALIRFYKDPDEFGPYNGMNREIMTIAQNMRQRDEHCNFKAYYRAMTGYPAKLYGPKNDNVPDLFGGFLTYEDMKQKLRDSRIYFYTGTQPASYTLNFIEALMSGIPVVAIGPRHGNSINDITGGGDMYEIPDIINNAVNGYISDDIADLRHAMDVMLDNPGVAKRIGEMGRSTAIKLFGKEVIKNYWKQFLGV